MTDRRMACRWVFFLSALVLGADIVLAAEPPQAPEEQYTIAFANFAPLKTNVFLANGDGTGAKPLLAGSDIGYNPSFSSDGAWIVFTSNRRGSADIYRIRPDGSDLELLTGDTAFDDQAALSPDGKTLAFVSTRSGRANIWLLEMENRKLTHLTNTTAGDFRPAWSPDGEWIAFSSDRDSPRPTFAFVALQTTEIFVVKRDGTGLQQITHSGGQAGSPSWSQDGSHILYYQATSEEGTKITSPSGLHGDMQIMSVNWRTAESEVMVGGSGEKWSPRWVSSSRVRYISGGINGGIEQIDGPRGARGEFWNANWSPDGKRMVFHRETGATWPPVQSWSSLNPAIRMIRTGIFPSFSPAGEALICNSGTAGMAHNSILVMRADGSNRKVIFDDPQRSALAPVWSPKGDWIAFGLGGFFQMLVGTREGVAAATSQLALIHPDGSGLRALEAAGRHAGFPSWSPDGKRIVYRSSNPQGKGLYLITIATGLVTELTHGAHNDNFPAWSPNGDRIAFTSDRDGDYEIYTIRPDGTDLRRLTRSPGNDAHCAWSPDGKWIAFASARAGFKDETLLHPRNPQPDGEIFIMRSDGSDVTQLTENQFEDATPTWKPAPSETRKRRR